VNRLLVPAAIATFALAAGGCGSGDTGEGPMEASGGAGEWTHQALDTKPGADAPVVLAVDGDRVAVVSTSEEGVITGFATDAGGEFRSGEPVATGLDFLALGGAVPFRGGWLSLGSGGMTPDREDLLFAVHAFRSGDGMTWSPVEAAGLTEPADVLGMAATEDAAVAVGVLRTADPPANGGFRGVAWHTADGESWAAVPLPTTTGAGTASAVAAVGDEFLAVGGAGNAGVLWSSTDGGASWAAVERPGLPATVELRDIAAEGDVVVVSGARGAEGEGEGRQVLARSTDGGATWHEVDRPPPPNRGEELPFPLSSGGGRFFTVGYSFVETWSDPELCYADITLCQQDMAFSLYASDDGDAWSRIDRSGIGEGDAGEVDQAVATDDGRVVALQRGWEDIGAWTWPARVPLPTEAEPVEPTSDVDLLEEGHVPEVGRRYAAPLYVHCGMDWLYLGGEPWQRTDDGPDVETGAGQSPSDEWPVAQQTIFGFATLVEDDLVEYSIGQGDDAEVIATYGPPTEEPPGCD
jgi:hypothetical protein